MAAVAIRALPGLAITQIGYPTSRRPYFQVTGRQPDAAYGALSGVVRIAPDTGELVQVIDRARPPAGNQVLRWIQLLHYGTFGPTLMKVVWCVLGLTPAVLAVTGGLMWWNRVLGKRWRAWRQA